MHKSSLYLPDDLKADLARLSSRSGRSEADLIRTAISSLVASEHAGETKTTQAVIPFRSPCCVLVGVGPGDPALVCDLARRTLSEADRVVVAAPDQRAVGRAELVVRTAAPGTKVTRVPFAFGGDEAARAESLGDIVDALVAGTDVGELVVLAVLGDPTQWAPFARLHSALTDRRPQLEVAVVPGVSAYQAVAAGARMALGGGGGSLVVVHDRDQLDRALADPAATVAVAKGSVAGAELKAVADLHGRHGLVGEMADLSGRGLIPVDALDDGPLAFLSTILFPSTTPDSP